MNTLLQKHTRSGLSGRLLNAVVLFILIVGSVTPPGTLTATTLPAGNASSARPAAAPGHLQAAALSPTAAAAATSWVFQGPAPQLNAQQDTANVPEELESVSGAVTAIAASPTNPDLVYLGTANGGVWKSTNATVASPTWTPLTDHLQSLSISIGALAFDPTISTGNTLVAGTGRFSGYGNRGDDLVGVYYTTDGGITWTTTTDPQLSAAKITGVAARGSTLLAASENGLFRSTTGPLGTWTKISGSGGLPNATANFVVGDPANPNVLYVGFLGASGGIFKTTDLGDSWIDISSGINVFSSSTTALSAAVFNDGATNVVTVALNGAVGIAIFRSVNGAAFTPLDVPGVFDDAYGTYGVAADKTNSNLVYLSFGYVLPGSSPFLASTSRLDASKPSDQQLTLLYGGVSTSSLTALTSTSTSVYVGSTAIFPTTTPFVITVDGEQMTVTSVTKPSWYYKLAVTRGANGTTAAAHAVNALVLSGAAYGAPHVDVNYLAVDAAGALLMGTHGSLYRLPEPASPPSATNTWAAKNGNLGVSEMHDVAYDHVTDTLIGSNQDNCVVFQSAPGSLSWPVGPGFSGDGGDVAVADLGGGQSVRYASNQNIGSFQRLIYDSTNTLVSATDLSTSVIADKQFTTPIAVNAVDPDRLLIGGSANLYESTDQGNTINKIATVGVYERAIAYGGRRNGVDNPDVLYVASGSATFYARTAAGGAVAATATPPSGFWYIRDIVINPADWMNVFAVDEDQVWATTNSGANWTNVTGNLLSISSADIRTIEFVEAPSPYIVVGTRSGVFASNLGALGSWFELGDALPDVLVYDLDYDAVDDVLAAGTLGRGAWLLSAASTALTPAGVPPVLALSGAATANEGTTQYTFTFTVTDPGDAFSVNGPTITGVDLVPGSLTTTGSGGSFKVTFPDGPATATISLQVTDSTGLASNTATTNVAVANVTATPAILGAPTSGSAGTTINLSSSVSDPSAVDTAAGFTYKWFAYKPAGAASIPNGAGSTFSFTPSIAGAYTVYLNVYDKDYVTGGSYRQTSKVIAIGSPDLTEDEVAVTVIEGQPAENSGTFQNVNGNPLTLSASVGSLMPTMTSSSLIFNSFSGSGAYPGPTVDTVFTTSQWRVITKIFNWHQNSSFHSGQNPTTVSGMISIFDYPSGTLQGTWPASAASGGLAWQVSPNILLPPGSYRVVESQTGPSSWSYTTSGLGAGPQWQPYKGLSQVTAADPAVGTWSWSYTPDDGPAQSQDVTITATDDVNGEVTSLSFPLTVLNGEPTATFANGGAVSEGSAGTVSFSGQSDPSTADTAAGFHYAYDFDNDGVFEIGDGAYAGSVTDASATVPASSLGVAEGPGARTILARILDKDGGYTDYTTSITINNAAPTASISGPATALEGQVISFLFEAADDSPADQLAGFIYSVDWGDGSTQMIIEPVAGTGDAVVGHAYATAGSYTIQVTATDKDGATSALASAAITVNTMNATNLQALVATAPFVDLAPADDAAFQNAVAAVNGLTDPGAPVAITIILGVGPYSGVTLSAPANILLDLAGNDTKSVDGTQIASSSGPAVTVTSGEVFVQGDHLATSANAPTVLVTGGHLTLDQVDIQESTGFNNVAVKVASGSANLGFDVILNVNGEGGFVGSYARTALVPHPEGIDAELTPNTFQVTGAPTNDPDAPTQGVIHAVSLSSTSLTGSPAPSVFSQAVTFTAKVDVNAPEHGPATGIVTFYDGTTVMGAGTVNYVSGQFVAGFTTSALSVGSHIITAVYSGDEAYVASSAVLAHTVVPYPFTGFFSPVDNPPVENQVKAGQGIPFKFNLGGDYGLGIVAAGYPKSQRIQCEPGVPVDPIEEITSSNSGLSYDPATGEYIYVWKTLKSWAGTCRQFTLRLTDGTDHIALFKFK